ncbi:hypothetical protein CO046_00735 [Candidatus Peregrinibacteria bacterium CG_4_9_14_0_2_um_filter_53_11]|nr:MAG: hypothetical protein CO046_00735 [Candidatus Peregrinibacteria bacterium CG_4_9_14_0_2_um_filter_53_11]
MEPEPPGDRAGPPDAGGPGGPPAAGELPETEDDQEACDLEHDEDSIIPVVFSRVRDCPPHEEDHREGKSSQGEGRPETDLDRRVIAPAEKEHESQHEPAEGVFGPN